MGRVTYLTSVRNMALSLPSATKAATGPCSVPRSSKSQAPFAGQDGGLDPRLSGLAGDIALKGCEAGDTLSTKTPSRAGDATGSSSPLPLPERSLQKM